MEHRKKRKFLKMSPNYVTISSDLIFVKLEFATENRVEKYLKK